MTILISVIMLLGVVCGYLFARIASLKEYCASLKSERDQWIDKATVRQGIGLLGKERQAPRPPENRNPSPVIATRATLAQRYQEEQSQEAEQRFNEAKQTTPIDISANSVKPPQKPIVAKAREILEH